MILFTEILPPGAPWSMRIARHRTVRLTALEPGANVSALFYNAIQPLDRLNVPDTLKALHTARLTRGHILMSDMGHALVSITEDSLGWHDPLGGHITAAQVERKYGVHRYQEFRNDFHRNARDNFLVELAKHGLGLRDIVANVNFFSRVTVDDKGRMHYAKDHCPAGATLSLRTEMDVLFVLANCPHPMAPAGSYPRVPVRVEILPAEPPGPDDFCRNFRPECGRALTLTERLHL
jgi:urea carboxylase-associated protein 2